MLLIILGALLLVTAAILLGQLNAAVRGTPTRDPGTRDALARAKTALIAWAATHPDAPGLLPFPDRNDDATPDYDGTSDCEPSATLGPGHLLGRFPVRGERTAGGCAADVPFAVALDDSSGERLWYAVSRNLVRGGGGGPINPDLGDLALQPWITVRDATGAVLSTRVAAVIIAPGAALGAQDRTGVAPGPGNYLDSLAVGANTYDNADADGCSDVGCATPGEEFIVNDNPQADDLFNDRLVFVTIDELMRAVEDRVVGDVARALRTYRAGFAPPNDYYPWLSPFTKPRPVQGVATGGSATTLVDAGTVFTGLVFDGDLVRNLSDGSLGRVATGGVTANTLTLEALVGGMGNVFAAGDQYVVHDIDQYKKGAANAAEGLLPLHYPNEVFRTGFTINWNFDNEAQTTGGDPFLQPIDQTPEEWDGNPLTIPYPDGLCMWTQVNRVDCRGTAFFPGAGMGGSDRTVQIWFNFTADTTTIVAPTATTPRTRNHTLNANTPYTDPIGPVPMLLPAGQTFSVRVIDDDGTPGACAPLGTATNCGWRTAEPDFDTDLTITQFDGIRYEIAVPDELPAWFVDNNWHQFVHGAASGANLPATASTSGDGTCTPPPPVPPFVLADEPDYCLTIEYNAVRVRDDVEALVIGSGAALAAQDRDAAGACPAAQPSFLCEYFESPNSRDFAPDPATRNVVFGRVPANTFETSATFNDQIRPVPPP